MPYNYQFLIYKIVVSGADYAASTGKSPRVVYLGENERKELRGYAEKLPSLIGKFPGTEDKVCGYEIVQVKRESYFAIG